MEKNMTPSYGVLYTFGYAGAGAGAGDALDAVMLAPMMLLVDIRLRPQSRYWPVWNKKHLLARWGSRYTHEKQLGNVNYKNRSLPVQLCGLRVEQAILGLVALLKQGYSVTLLCACRDFETCHRKVVAELIQHGMQGVCPACLQSVEETMLYCVACRPQPEGEEHDGTV